VKPFRIGVWDSSPSIRALLRRVLSRLEGVEVTDLERGLEDRRLGSLPGIDVIILGSGPAGFEPTLLTRGTKAESHPRIILLTPPGFLPRERRMAAPIGESGLMLPKPATSEGWERLGTQLTALIRDMSVAVRSRAHGAAAIKRPRPHRRPAGGGRSFRLAVAGGSSGGPAALHALLSSVGREPFPGVAVVQHIATGFEVELTRWLARDLELDVAVAEDGEPLLPGTVRIAPARFHLRLQDDRTLRLDDRTPPRNGHRPSVDELFLSVEKELLPATVAILLDGMGRDGVEGLGRIRAGGGATIVQDPDTCAVGGMPLAALQEGAAMWVLSPAAIGRFLASDDGEGSSR